MEKEPTRRFVFTQYSRRQPRSNFIGEEATQPSTAQSFGVHISHSRKTLFRGEELGPNTHTENCQILAIMSQDCGNAGRLGVAHFTPKDFERRCCDTICKSTRSRSPTLYMTDRRSFCAVVIFHCFWKHCCFRRYLVTAVAAESKWTERRSCSSVVHVSTFHVSASRFTLFLPLCTSLLQERGSVPLSYVLVLGVVILFGCQRMLSRQSFLGQFCFRRTRKVGGVARQAEGLARVVLVRLKI
jgi:hypothetical protein